MEAYHAQVLDNAVVNSVNSAIAAYRDPKMVDVELSKAVGAIEGSAKRMGWGPDAVAMKTREVTSTTHLGVISNLLAEEKTDQAEFYFQQKAGAISATNTTRSRAGSRRRACASRASSRPTRSSARAAR